MRDPKKSSKKPADKKPLEPPPSSLETLRTCCKIEITPSFKRSAKKYSAGILEEVARRITAVGESFGKPHLHSGLGIRDLSAPNLFECRLGLHVRLIFRKDGDTKPPTLFFVLMGDHASVTKYLKR